MTDKQFKQLLQRMNRLEGHMMAIYRHLRRLGLSQADIDQGIRNQLPSAKRMLRERKEGTRDLELD